LNIDNNAIPNHRKFMKAEPSQLMPRKLAANLDRITVVAEHFMNIKYLFPSSWHTGVGRGGRGARLP